MNVELTKALRKIGYSLLDGNLIHETAVIHWDYVRMGTGNIIGPHTVIGSPGEIRGKAYHEFKGFVTIGDDNRISEHVTIQRPYDQLQYTHVSNRTIIMAHTHIGHDAFIGNDVELCSGCVIGGYARILEGAKVKLNATIRNRVIVAKRAVVGMGAVVTKHVGADETWYGNPAAPQKTGATELETLGQQAENVARNLVDLSKLTPVDMDRLKASADGDVTIDTNAFIPAEELVNQINRQPKFKVGDWVRQNADVDPYDEGTIWEISDVVSKIGPTYLLEGAYDRSESTMLPERRLSRVEHRVRRPGEQLIVLKDQKNGLKRGDMVVVVDSTQDTVNVVSMDGDKLYSADRRNRVKTVRWQEVTSANKFCWQDGRHYYPKNSEGYRILDRLARDLIPMPSAVQALLEDWLMWDGKGVSLEIDSEKWPIVLESLTEFVNSNYRNIQDIKLPKANSWKVGDLARYEVGHADCGDGEDYKQGTIVLITYIDPVDYDLQYEVLSLNDMRNTVWLREKQIQPLEPFEEIKIRMHLIAEQRQRINKLTNADT